VDGYQFIASLFQSLTSLAWPTALIVAVWLFRERLLSLMPLLRVKYKDFDVSFRLDQTEKDAAALPPQVGGPVSNPTPEEKTRFEQIAELSPRAKPYYPMSQMNWQMPRSCSIPTLSKR
jgi:hypothetical protein